MTDQTKKIIGVIGFILLCSMVVIVGLLALNSLSCVSMPKEIKGEPMICAEAKQWAYLAAATDKSKTVPESVSTEGIRSCAALLRYKYCKEEREQYLESQKQNVGQDNWRNYLIETKGEAIFKDCLLNNKP